jgi:predicted transcriptional regulator
MTEIFDLETRKKIYHLIDKHPGLNLSTIADLLQMGVSLVDYHTRHMENHELITIVKEGGYKRYYVKGKIGAEDKKFCELLRQEIPLRIVIFLLNNPNSQHKDILKHFDIAKATLSYHLKKLVMKEIICVHVHGEEKEYCVTNEKRVIRFLIQYKPSQVLKRFKETWVGFRIP